MIQAPVNRHHHGAFKTGFCWRRNRQIQVNIPGDAYNLLT